MDYEKFIVKQRVVKRYRLQISIPTHTSYEVTKDTLIKLYDQTNPQFDILLIDSGSDDYIKLKKDFPKLNYILLNDNYGSSGAQYVGLVNAINNGYEYVVITDNDAILLTKDGIDKMVRYLDKHDNVSAVVPKSVEHFENLVENINLDSWAFHYLMARVDIIKKVKPHNFYLFLYCDDLCLTSKLSSYNGIKVLKDVEYYHYAFAPKSMSNFYNYFYLRGLLYVFFMELNINWRVRLKIALQLIYKLFQLLINSLLLFDFTYIYTIYLSIRGVMKMDNDFRNLIPVNKFNYIEVEKDGSNGNYVNARNKYKMFVFPKKLKFKDKYKDKFFYYRRVSSLVS